MVYRVKALILLSVTIHTASSCTELRHQAYCQARTAPSFELQDSSQSPIRLTDLRGQYVLLGFGFFHCAQQCPITLSAMVDAIAEASSAGFPIRGYFVNLNPGVGDIAELRAFESSVNWRVRWLNGRQTTIQQVAKDYHVWHFRHPLKAHEPGYQVEHSAMVTLIDPAGDIRCVYNDPEDLRSRLPGDMKLIRESDP